MNEIMCICCGAELDRSWQFAIPISQSMCCACTVEVEAASSLTQIEELASLGLPLF